MKHTKFFIFALVAAMTFSACGTDDSLEITKPDQVNGGNNSGGNTGGGNTGGNTGGSTGGSILGDNTPGVSTNKANQNMNMPTAIMPEVVKNAINGLEFPKIKGGSSYVVTHMADNAVNFSSEWDDNLQAQRWTCYFYCESNKGGNVGRTGEFINDPDMAKYYPGITEFASTPYQNSGYDRGHLIASNERQVSVASNKQTFYFTNMQPQYSTFNQSKGIWFAMEQQNLKKNISGRDTLFVVKGGTIENGNVIEYVKNRSHIKPSEYVKQPHDGYIPVPKYFFVAFLEKTYNIETDSFKYNAFGYWFLHENKAFDSKDKLVNYIVNIKTLEDKTGIDFFCNLPDNIEQEVENKDIEAIKNHWGW